MVENYLVKSSLDKNKKDPVESDLPLKNRQFVRKKIIGLTWPQPHEIWLETSCLGQAQFGRKNANLAKDSDNWIENQPQGRGWQFGDIDNLSRALRELVQVSDPSLLPDTHKCKSWKFASASL